MNSTQPKPRPMKVSLISAPKYPLGVLYYVWKQSRYNNPLPDPMTIEDILNCAKTQNVVPESSSLAHDMKRLGFEHNQVKECARSIRDEIQMILHESIPVTENLHFVFHLENIPISLREQLVRHRIGTAIDPKVGIDIVPAADGELYAAFQRLTEGMPTGAMMNIQTIPDLAESTWWSQTSRVINQGAFYDEGRFLLPESLAGKVCKYPEQFGDDTGGFPTNRPAETVYRECLQHIQTAYNALVAAGVHIEDARQLIPVGATHGITWGLNLKAMLHIFGKRSSWISQIGIWGDVMGQMADELVKQVHPMFRMVLLPQCIKRGQYVGCPVNGTNVERIQGTDGMPPCPLWVRYETTNALDAYRAQIRVCNTTADPDMYPVWVPPFATKTSNCTDEDCLDLDCTTHTEHIDAKKVKDVREWTTDKPVEQEMLLRAAGKYSKLWGFNILEGIPEQMKEDLS